MTTLNSTGMAYARSLISSGSVNKSSSWSFSAEDGDALLGKDGSDWANYASHHLGVDPSATDKTKARWKYPFAKGGTLYRSALIAIRQRAGQQDDTGIFDAAGALLDKIDPPKALDLSELQISPLIEVKFLDDGADIGTFDGYAACFNGVDGQNDTIMPGAFADTIAQHQAAGTAPALLWNHDMAEPVGKLVGMQEDARGLRVKGMLNLRTTAGVKAHEHLKAGDVTGLSVGYVVPPGGQEIRRSGPRVLKKLNVHEVSIASMPADTRARVTGVKMLTSLSELERGLRGELKLELPRGAAAKIAAVGWPALVGGGEDPADPDPAKVAALATKVDAAVLELKSLKKGKR